MSGLRRRSRRPSPLVLAVAVVTTFVIVVPSLVPGDPIAQDLARALEAPSARHPLGTDQFGRDVAVRLLIGARSSYLAAIAVVALGFVVGGLAGVAAALAPRPVKLVLDRLIDVALGLPGIVLALALVAALGGGQRNVVLALAIGIWPWYARLAREHATTLATRPFVSAARLAGRHEASIWLGHLAPHIARRLAIVAALDVGYTIVAFAGLGYLGLGSEQPAPDLGSMLRDGQDFFLDASWLLLAPSGAIALIVLPFVVAGERSHAGGLA